MKKHWKKIVLVLGLLFLSVAGYLIYLFQFKEYDVADEEVTGITREAYEIELPDGSFIIIDEDGNVVEQPGNGASGENGGAAAGEEGTDASADTADGAGDASGSSDGSSGDSSGGVDGSGTSSTSSGTASGSSDGSSGSGNSGSDSGSGGSDGNGTSGSGGNTSGGNGSTGSGGNGAGGSGNSGSDAGSAGKVTVAQIKQKFEPTMADIEGQANTRINSLISRAKTEYSSKQSAGESISYPYFYNKYMGAATDLEERTDQAFYAVLGAMKKELKANGLAESHADTLVSEYEARKEARKSNILKQATGF